MNIYQQGYWSLYIATLEEKVERLEDNLARELRVNKILHNQIKKLFNGHDDLLNLEGLETEEKAKEESLHA